MIAPTIINFLKAHASEEARRSWLRSVKTHSNAYGVKLAEINKLIPLWAKEATLEDVKVLWRDGKVESRIIASKLLGKLGKKEAEKAFSLLPTLISDLNDWATTDTLATQGVRGMLKLKEKGLKALALSSLESPNPWEQRFGIVFFINFPNDPLVPSVVKRFINHTHPYVRKAAEWLKRKAGF